MTLKLSGENYHKRLINFLQKKETKAYTMAILSFFTLSFFTLFAIKPTLVTLFNLKKQIKDSEEIDRRLETKINTLLEAQEEYQKNEKSLNLLKEALPEEPQFPALVRKLEQLAQEQGASISALQVEHVDFLGRTAKESSNDKPKKFGFSLTISAQYLQLESFLQKLVNLRRIITLEDLKFSGGKEPQVVELTLKGKAYYLKRQRPL